MRLGSSLLCVTEAACHLFLSSVSGNVNLVMTVLLAVSNQLCCHPYPSLHGKFPHSGFRGRHFWFNVLQDKLSFVLSYFCFCLSSVPIFTFPSCWMFVFWHAVFPVDLRRGLAGFNVLDIACIRLSLFLLENFCLAAGKAHSALHLIGLNLFFLVGHWRG